MPTQPDTADLSRKAGISLSYASEIVNKKRNPSRPLAIHIYRRTGWRHELLSGLSDDEISLLEKIEPYQAKCA